MLELGKPPNQKYCLIVSLFSVLANPYSEFPGDLSEFFVPRALNNFFYTGHPKLTTLGVERLCEAITDDRKDIPLQTAGALSFAILRIRSPVNLLTGVREGWEINSSPSRAIFGLVQLKTAVFHSAP